MIILEGTDLVGKTTLAETLLENFDDYWYRHVTKPPKVFNPLEVYTTFLHPKSVQDRYHMSELVYQQVTGRPELLTTEMYRLIDAQLRTLGVLTVVIVASERLLRERFLEREEMYGINTILSANRLYEHVATCPFYDCDILIRCTPDKPFPNEYDVKNILNLYHERQEAIHDIIS